VLLVLLVLGGVPWGVVFGVGLGVGGLWGVVGLDFGFVLVGLGVFGFGLAYSPTARPKTI
jgi:hypothetical protein